MALMAEKQNLDWFLLRCWVQRLSGKICNLYSVFVWSVMIWCLCAEGSTTWDYWWRSTTTTALPAATDNDVLRSSPLLSASWLEAFASVWGKWISIFCHFAAGKNVFTYWAYVRLCNFFFIPHNFPQLPVPPTFDLPKKKKKNNFIMRVVSAVISWFLAHSLPAVQAVPEGYLKGIRWTILSWIQHNLLKSFQVKCDIWG